MTKDQMLKILVNSANLYHTNLCNYQLMFIYLNANHHVSAIEVKFRSYNFLHFTGVIPRKGITAKDFYRYLINNRLSISDFNSNPNHTTELKLRVLPTIMNIDTTARMIGNYVGPHIELYTEKIVGTTTACLGLLQKNEYYIPNSVLHEDIRNITPHPPGKILAILKKQLPQALYADMTYKSPKLQNLHGM